MTQQASCGHCWVLGVPQKHFSVIDFIRQQSLLTPPDFYSLVLHVLCSPQLRGKAFLSIQSLTETLSWPLLHAGRNRFHWVISLGRCQIQLPRTPHPYPEGHFAPHSKSSACFISAPFHLGCSDPNSPLGYKWKLSSHLALALHMAPQAGAFRDHWLHGNLNLQANLLEGSRIEEVYHHPTAFVDWVGGSSLFLFWSAHTSLCLWNIYASIYLKKQALYNWGNFWQIPWQNQEETQ